MSIGVALVKVFHSGQNSESGASMVALLVGMALSAISVAAAAAFFVQTNTKAKALMGESESISNLALLLKQAFNERECLKLDIYKGRFTQKIAAPIILTDEVPATTAQTSKGGTSKFDEKGISVLKNSVGKSYEVKRVQMVQRTSVIGRDPGRVLADLRIQIAFKGQISDKKKDETQILTIPLLFDLDDTLMTIGCMQKPDPVEICKKNNGIFDDKAPISICSLSKP